LRERKGRYNDKCVRERVRSQRTKGVRQKRKGKTERQTDKEMKRHRQRQRDREREDRMISHRME
jgi:hypothetical protein